MGDKTQPSAQAGQTSEAGGVAGEVGVPHSSVDLHYFKRCKERRGDTYSTRRGEAKDAGMAGATRIITPNKGKENLCSLLLKSGPGGVVELDFDKSISDGVNIYAKRDGDADFVFLARDTASPYIDNRPLLVATKPELREYKAVYVQSDAEIGLFSDEVVVNCAVNQERLSATID